MGFWDKLLGELGGGSRRPCPDCGELLSGGDGGRYECQNEGCTGWRVYFDEDGLLRDPPSRVGPRERTCPFCQSSLRGGDSYLPYEDGSNEFAYVVCPSCRSEVIREGFGE